MSYSWKEPKTLLPKMQQSSPGVEKDKPILKNGRVGHQYPYHQNPFTS